MGTVPSPRQEVLADGKRETTTSQLAINPTDLDIGRVFSCRSTNDAIPAGKETFVKLNVHRESGPGAEGTSPAWRWPQEGRRRWPLCGGGLCVVVAQGGQGEVAPAWWWLTCSWGRQLGLPGRHGVPQGLQPCGWQLVPVGFTQSLVPGWRWETGLGLGG